MTTKRKVVRVLFPLTKAADLLDMKFEELRAAADRGVLEVTYAVAKPGGDLQPVVTADEIRRFKDWRAEDLEAADSDYFCEIATRLRARKVPPDSAHLSEVLRPRKPRWTGKRRARRERAAKSAAASNGAK